MPITRRRLIAASGAGLAAGGAAALSGCGGDPGEDPSPQRDVELLQRALEAQAAVNDLYGLAGEQQLDEPVAEAMRQFEQQSSRHARQLARRIEEAGGTPADPDASPPVAESVVEAIGIALEEAVAAGHRIVGTLSSPEARRTVYRMMSADAAQLAVVRGVLGEDQVPVAFVTGRPEPPVAVELEPDASEGGGS
jgi:hypothetical protein